MENLSEELAKVRNAFGEGYIDDETGEFKYTSEPNQFFTNVERRETTSLTRPQLKDNDPKASELPYTFQAGHTDYE